MAKREVHVCDVQEHGAPCGKPGRSWTMWREGDRQAQRVDLCDKHAAPLTTILSQAELIDLPSRPRARMQVTELKPTPSTAHLKKK